MICLWFLERHIKGHSVQLSLLQSRKIIDHLKSFFFFFLSFSARIATEQNIILSKERILIWSAMNGNRLGELPTVSTRRRGNHSNHTRFLIHPFLASKPDTRQQLSRSIKNILDSVEPSDTFTTWYRSICAATLKKLNIQGNFQLLPSSFYARIN